MIIALDLETTWLDNKKDKIIEVALIAFDEYTFEIQDTFTTLINPWISIPEITSNITGIFDLDVKTAPIFDDHMRKKIQDFIWENPILWHNTYFDRDFLMIQGVDIEKNLVLDTFVLANFLAWKEKSLNLWALCESFWIDMWESHRAFDDTKATLQLFQYFTKQFRELWEKQKQLLADVFSKSYDPTFAFYREYFEISSFVKISQDDFIKTILGVVWKYEPPIEITEKQHIWQDITEIFSKLPNFEIRENQAKMAQKVQTALFENKKMVIEAPTGVWKTFAYSLPSVLYALQFEETVLISTHTKALQDQIFYKDLAYLKQHIWTDFSYTKLKGKKNYFSLCEFFSLYFQGGAFSLDETSLYAKIVVWLFETEFWELDELTLYPKELPFVKQFHADHFFVLQDENEYKYYEFLFKARSAAKTADIVIVNHSILIQDLKSKNGFFSDIKNVIIDEAHNLEDTTTDALKRTIQLAEISENSQKILSILSKNSQSLENLDTLFEDIFHQTAFCFDLLWDYANSKNTYGNEVFDVGIEADFFRTDIDILSLSGKLQEALALVFEKLNQLHESVYVMIRSNVTFFEEMLDIISITFDEKSSKEYISLFSLNQRYGASLWYTFLHPWKFLKTHLYDTVHTIILTSATLQIDGKFDYFKNILSFDEDFETFLLESDFDYKKQALLFLPNNLWSARYNNPVLFQFIQDFVTLVKGKTLVLMTSFSSIRDAYIFMNSALKKIGIDVLAQSIWWSKYKIINHYKKHFDKSMILGTDSFWEGIDFPWDELKYLVIHKFPFDVPTDPIFKARSKLFNDSFSQYSIPKAIIKTKQGFGRLIRTKNDTGIVVLLDDRVLQTSWWSQMLQAFPPEINKKTWHSDTFLQMLSKKQEW